MERLLRAAGTMYAVWNCEFIEKLTTSERARTMAGISGQNGSSFVLSVHIGAVRNCIYTNTTKKPKVMPVHSMWIKKNSFHLQQFYWKTLL